MTTRQKNVHALVFSLNLKNIAELKDKMVGVEAKSIMNVQHPSQHCSTGQTRTFTSEQEMCDSANSLQTDADKGKYFGEASD